MDMLETLSLATPALFANYALSSTILSTLNTGLPKRLQTLTRGTMEWKNEKIWDFLGKFSKHKPKMVDTTRHNASNNKLTQPGSKNFDLDPSLNSIILCSHGMLLELKKFHERV